MSKASLRPFFLGRSLRHRVVNSTLLLLLLVLPILSLYTGSSFWLEFGTRLTILALAAVSLNFILGYGGMVSFGHAAFIGIGAYAVGIPAYYDNYAGWLHVLCAALAGGLFALITGAISLRTRGVHFIMITMAFAQMMFYVIVSVEEYGADDGLVINERSIVPGLDLADSLTMFLVSYGSLLVVLYLVYRLIHSRFGRVLRGAQSNQERMHAVGFSVYRYKLVAYVISGMLCAYAGALLGNFTNFISPEMTDWTRSGELMFMVILGGVGSLFGPVLGAALFLVLEEVLSAFTVHWHLPFGILLILSVLFVRGGVLRFLHGKDSSDD